MKAEATGAVIVTLGHGEARALRNALNVAYQRDTLPESRELLQELCDALAYAIDPTLILFDERGNPRARPGGKSA